MERRWWASCTIACSRFMSLDTWSVSEMSRRGIFYATTRHDSYGRTQWSMRVESPFACSGHARSTNNRGRFRRIVLWWCLLSDLLRGSVVSSSRSRKECIVGFDCVQLACSILSCPTFPPSAFQVLSDLSREKVCCCRFSGSVCHCAYCGRGHRCCYHRSSSEDSLPLRLILFPRWHIHE